jgi:hypothetical protein
VEFSTARAATLFHCAGIIHPGGRDFIASASGTRGLLDGAIRAGVRQKQSVVELHCANPCARTPSPKTHRTIYMGDAQQDGGRRGVIASVCRERNGDRSRQGIPGQPASPDGSTIRKARFPSLATVASADPGLHL